MTTCRAYSIFSIRTTDRIDEFWDFCGQKSNEALSLKMKSIELKKFSVLLPWNALRKRNGKMTRVLTELVGTLVNDRTLKSLLETSKRIAGYSSPRTTARLTPTKFRERPTRIGRQWVFQSNHKSASTSKWVGLLNILHLTFLWTFKPMALNVIQWKFGSKADPTTHINRAARHIRSTT